MWLLLAIILNNTYYENLMFAGTVICTVMYSSMDNAHLIRLCCNYKCYLSY